MVIIKITDANGIVQGYLQTVGYDAMHDLMQALVMPEGWRTETILNDSDH